MRVVDESIFSSPATGQFWIVLDLGHSQCASGFRFESVEFWTFDIVHLKGLECDGCYRLRYSRSGNTCLGFHMRSCRLYVHILQLLGISMDINGYQISCVKMCQDVSRCVKMCQDVSRCVKCCGKVWYELSKLESSIWLQLSCCPPTGDLLGASLCSCLYFHLKKCSNVINCNPEFRTQLQFMFLFHSQIEYLMAWRSLQCHNVSVCIEHVAVQQIKDTGLKDWCKKWTRQHKAATSINITLSEPHRSTREQVLPPCQVNARGSAVGLQKW